MPALVFALEQEARAFIERGKLKAVKAAAYPLFEGPGYSLVISGMGKANASSATEFTIRQLKPGYIINMGSCGSAGEPFNPGLIYQIDRITEPERLPENTVLRPHTLSGFECASLATMDRPVITDEDRKFYSAYASLFDMEGAAICRACLNHSVKPLVFKIVTDTMQDSDLRSIIRQIELSSPVLYQFFIDRLMPALIK